MVKKMKSSSKSDTDRGDLAASVKESAQQIWLAGMGAFAKAQEEGTKVFSQLVKEGKSLQAKTQGMAGDKISEVTTRMTAMADTVQNRAGQNWDKLEGIFEQRTAKAMGKLGVPTAKELSALSSRVNALEAAVARMGQMGRSAGTPPSAKVAPSKSAKRAAAQPKATAKAATNSATKSARKTAAVKPAASKTAPRERSAAKKA